MIYYYILSFINDTKNCTLNFPTFPQYTSCIHHLNHTLRTHCAAKISFSQPLMAHYTAEFLILPSLARAPKSLLHLTTRILCMQMVSTLGKPALWITTTPKYLTAETTNTKCEVLATKAKTQC